MSKNIYRSWNTSSSTSIRSTNENDASNRVYDGFFTPQNLPRVESKLSISESIFTMGSCFARELESVLRSRGFRISSMDLDKLKSPDLWSDQKATINFFHRYNLASMEIEFRRSIDDIEFDAENDLLVETADGYLDLNYGPFALKRLDRAGGVKRRSVAKEMVRNFATSKWIILTLGLTEAWFHKPSGMFCNGLSGDVLGRNRDDFEFRVLGFNDNLRSLENIYDCLKRKHTTGDFRFVVTVSPVPLQTTFSMEDVVVANTRSKSVLRSVADEFCRNHPEAIYFPSYEIALNSDRGLVWRPDRVHINPECVAHIMGVFTEAYVDAASIAPALDWRTRLKRALS